VALAKLAVFIMPVNIFKNEHLLRDKDDDDDGFIRPVHAPTQLLLSRNFLNFT
jgi:hypothetical protein